MRNVFQLLSALTLLAAQVTAQPVVTASTNATAAVEKKVGVLQFDSRDPRAVSVKVEKPDFEAEVLAPLRAAQEAKAKADALAEAQRQAALAAQRAAQVKPVAFRSTATGPLNAAQINFLGNCESGMTWNRNSGNGYYGAFQFSIPTWNAMGTGYARADMAPLEVQIDAVQRLLSRSSIFSQFPGCARQMQANGLL